MKKKNTLNYLFRNKMLNALIFFGFFGNIPFLRGQEIADYPPIIQRNVMIQDSLFNPFLFENLGVPFDANLGCGTSFLMRMQTEDAQEIINKVFEEEGIKLQKDYYYKKDNITIVLDGFDPDLNIGYIWLSHDKMGAEMGVKSERLRKLWTQKNIENLEQKAVLTEILDSILNIKKEKVREIQYNNFVKFVSISYWEKVRETENSTTQKILFIKNKREMAQAIQEFGHRQLSLQEARYLENIHETEEDFIATISVRDGRFSHFRVITVAENQKLLEFEKKFGGKGFKQLHSATFEAALKRGNVSKVVRKNLETQVRQYIQWAKQQGGH